MQTEAYVVAAPSYKDSKEIPVAVFMSRDKAEQFLRQISEIAKSAHIYPCPFTGYTEDIKRFQPYNTRDLYRSPFFVPNDFNNHSIDAQRYSTKYVNSTREKE